MLGAAGNAAVSRRLARDKRPPSVADVKRLWVDKWTATMDAEDCGTVARRMAGLLGGVKYPPPKAMLKDDLIAATPEEEQAARSRGVKHSDRVFPGPPDVYRVYSGPADKLDAEFHLLRPGMLIYTAESLAWRDRARKLYRWHDRHMLMYGGGGIAYENFVPASSPRDISKDPTAYAGSLFSVGLAIYDPFEGVRKGDAADEFIVDMLNVRDDLAGRLDLLLETLPVQR